MHKSSCSVDIVQCVQGNILRVLSRAVRRTNERRHQENPQVRRTTPGLLPGSDRVFFVCSTVVAFHERAIRFNKNPLSLVGKGARSVTYSSLAASGIRQVCFPFQEACGTYVSMPSTAC